jgi:cytidylate kinase
VSAAAAPRAVVAIDGPAGVGKSAVARRVARALGLPYLDTGAMYRAVAWKALQRSVDPDDAAAVEELARGARFDLEAHPDGAVEILLDGEPVEPHIRELGVSEMASRLAAQPEVRRRLVELQRELGRAHGAVMEGRDIGTVVFPDTPHKFFLDARPEVRVGRRREQLRAAGREVSAGEVEQELLARDRRDRERSHSPLSWDESYRHVDTSELSLDEVAARLVAAVRAAGA